MDESPELRLLFHRLNNQLGIVLAHAELLEAKAPDDMYRARAAQIVASALDYYSSLKSIAQQRRRAALREATGQGAEPQELIEAGLPEGYVSQIEEVFRPAGCPACSGPTVA